MLYPKYGEHIIVGIMRDTGFAWYVTDCDAWILNINKYANAFEENGFAFHKEFALSIRENIEVVNENTVEPYLFAYQENIVSTNTLKELIVRKKYKDTILSLKPSLYIDFIERRLLSLYPESLAFEKYVPEGWIGRYEDFTGHIPNKDRYWIMNGINVIDEEFENERNEFRSRQ